MIWHKYTYGLAFILIFNEALSYYSKVSMRQR